MKLRLLAMVAGLAIHAGTANAAGGAVATLSNIQVTIFSLGPLDPPKTPLPPDSPPRPPVFIDPFGGITGYEAIATVVANPSDPNDGSFVSKVNEDVFLSRGLITAAAAVSQRDPLVAQVTSQQFPGQAFASASFRSYQLGPKSGMRVTVTANLSVFDNSDCAPGELCPLYRAGYNETFITSAGGPRDLTLTDTFEILNNTNGIIDSGLGIGVLTYIQEFTAPVPEPQTYAMLLAGLAAVGAIARRRCRSEPEG